jgi:hypothetical protein
VKVTVLEESGYEAAALGFSLSYNTTIERAKELMPRFAFGKMPGENKFLRVMQVIIDTDIPRLMWPEADQYKVGTTTLSESTMHTLKKRPLAADDFFPMIDDDMLAIVNRKIEEYNHGFIGIDKLKAHLPEGFLQRRVWVMNYANLQNIIVQRTSHRLPQWQVFIHEVLAQVQHPEFLVKKEN